MMLAILAALLAQSDPRIESVEHLLGKVRRPYFWTPLAVTVRSVAGFEGDLVAQSSMGIRVVRKIRVAAGGSERVLLPAIDPQKIIAGGASIELSKDLKSPDFAVLVDARLPYSSGLPSSDTINYQRIEVGDLKELLAQGILDACDLVLVKDASGLSLGSVRAWAAAPSESDARKAIGERLKPGEPVSLIERRPNPVDDLWSLAPEGGWVPVKKDRAVLFAALYAFAVFAALVFVGRRRPWWSLASVAGVAALGVVSFLLFFPRRHLWIAERSCEIVPPEGDSMVVRLWFAGAATELAPAIEFPSVVKPIYQKPADAEEPLTIRLREHGCLVEGFALSPSRSLCFGSVEGRAPTMRLGRSVERPLYRAGVKIGGRARSVGDLPAGGAVPREAVEGPSDVRLAPVRPWLRFLEGDGIFGYLERGARAAEDVGSPDLADGRRGPLFFIQRFK